MFNTKVIVLPAGLRDYVIMGDTEEQDEVNKLYRKLMGNANTVTPQMFEISPKTYDRVRSSMQAAFNAIYEYYENIIFGKNKLIQGHVMTSQVIDGTRSVFTAQNIEVKERFLLHYNFPPFSTGEAKAQRGVGRREIGHGHLAWRALKGQIPADYPYCVRVVSDILESNGSSSMATVCAGTLALMDAGVPIKKPVSGIAMGLIKNAGEDKYAVLSEILGCGMVDPAVLEANGIDSKVYTGYAFGMGVERIANLKYKVKDLRMFSENDTRFLEEFEAAN
jgi:hypothetical protein